MLSGFDSVGEVTWVLVIYHRTPLHSSFLYGILACNGHVAMLAIFAGKLGRF